MKLTGIFIGLFMMVYPVFYPILSKIPGLGFFTAFSMGFLGILFFPIIFGLGLIIFLVSLFSH